VVADGINVTVCSKIDGETRARKGRYHVLFWALSSVLSVEFAFRLLICMQ